MVEVIKHGENFNDKKLTTKCESCGCVFSFVDKESYYGGDLIHNRVFCVDYVCCPECNNEISVHSTSCLDNYNDILCNLVGNED